MCVLFSEMVGGGVQSLRFPSSLYPPVAQTPPAGALHHPSPPLPLGGEVGGAGDEVGGDGDEVGVQVMVRLRIGHDDLGKWEGND